MNITRSALRSALTSMSMWSVTLIVLKMRTGAREKQRRHAYEGCEIAFASSLVRSGLGEFQGACALRLCRVSK